MSGDWIKIDRKLLESRVFSEPDLLRLWMWCLLKTNWKRSWFKGREIEPGQFATGRLSAADELGVSGSKWYRGMQALSEFGMVKIESVNNRFSVVSVVNWASYQSKRDPQRTAGEQPVNSSRTAGEQPVNTIEEGKKGRREDKKESSATPPVSVDPVPPTAAEVQAYIDHRHATNPNWPRATDLTGESFCDHYDGQGWVTGANIPIKDWKAKVRAWGNKAPAPTRGPRRASGPKTFVQQREDANDQVLADFLSARQGDDGQTVNGTLAIGNENES